MTEDEATIESLYAISLMLSTQNKPAMAETITTVADKLKVQQAQSGATNDYIALADTWEKIAKSLDNEIQFYAGEIGIAGNEVKAWRNVLRFCAEKLRAV